MLSETLTNISVCTNTTVSYKSLLLQKPSNLNTLIPSLSYEHDQYKLMNIGFVNVYFQVNKILKLNWVSLGKD